MGRYRAKFAWLNGVNYTRPKLARWAGLDDKSAGAPDKHPTKSPAKPSADGECRLKAWRHGGMEATSLQFVQIANRAFMSLFAMTQLSVESFQSIF